MKRKRIVAILLIAFACAAAPAVAQDAIEPGLWKISTKVLLNGNPTPVEVKTRCITAEQASDVVKTFSPAFAVVNANCERDEPKFEGGKLSWRLVCKGQMDTDVSGEFNFSNPKHYTAVVVTKGWLAGQQVVNSSAAIEGEHAGACP